jgi:seryl-tRNA synthetase
MNDKPKPTSDGPGDLMHLWFDAASHVMEACQTWAGAAVSPEAFRQNRSNLFKTWSDTWEQYLRSSSFLEMQKRCLTGSVELKKQSREYLERMHHELQMASSGDIDHLVAAMRRMEENIRGQFEQVEGRLNALSSQLDALSARLKAQPDESVRTNNKKQRKTNHRGKTPSLAR